ncbi:MAG: NAD-dependent epimerase/dehydratase family protein [Candidatus Heimdallarchaeota archaeon]
MSEIKHTKKKRILITGANGFVGSNLTKFLSRDPSLEVYAMVRPNAPVNFLMDFQNKLDSDEKWFQLVEANLLSEESMVNAFKDIDVVIHLAGFVSDWGERKRYWQMNVSGTENVLAAASKAKVSRVLFLSSLTVHGLKGHKYDDENTPRNVKRFPYGESKKIGEDLVFEWGEKTPNADSAIIRPGFIIYGLYDKNTFIKALDVIASGKFAFINGGRRLVSYVFVENLCYGIMQLAKAQEIRGAYNILDGNTTWRNWVGFWEKAINRKVTKFSVPYIFMVPTTALLVGFYKLFGIKKNPPLNFYRINIMRRDLAFVNTRITSEIGYDPPVKLDEGIQKTLKFYYETKKKSK